MEIKGSKNVAPGYNEAEQTCSGSIRPDKLMKQFVTDTNIFK